MPYTVSDRIRLFFNGKRDDLSQGDCYLHGLYVAKDVNTALMLYERAAMVGNASAHFRIGLIYHHRRGGADRAAQAYFDAFSLDGNLLVKAALSELAVAGNVLARFYLGHVFESLRDWEKAKGNYELAVAGGSTPAFYYLGRLYHEDRSLATDPSRIVINKNVSEELRYYKEAFIRGSIEALTALEHAAVINADAAFHLATAYKVCGRDSENKALSYFLRAKDLGHVEAAYCLGQLYEMGSASAGVVDLVKACEFYLLAAQKGNAASLAKLTELAVIRDNAELFYQLAAVYFSVFANKLEALKWYKISADKGYEKSSARLFEISKGDAEFAYALGQAYENECVGLKNLTKAFYAYAQAMNKGHLEAKNYVFRVADAGHAEAQYALGYHHYHQLGNVEEAVKWCMRAVEQNHTQALKYLTETKFSCDLCLKVADQYCKGEGVLVNLAHAVNFYMKASTLNNAYAAFCLAKIYEVGGSGLVADQARATEFYVLAANRGHLESLSALERIAELLKNKEFNYQLAGIYLMVFKNKTSALKWYKQAADQGFPKALSELIEISKIDPEFAYATAQLYETEAKKSEDMQQAFSFYALAMRNKYLKAQERLMVFVSSKNADAQYALGYEYYHQEKNLIEAAKWCMRAVEQGHVRALHYLTETKFSIEVCLDIARQYENADGVAVNIKQAIDFYTKASHLGHKPTALKLASLYEKTAISSKQDCKMACYYYIQAVNYGYLSALDLLERVAEVADSDTQLAVAKLYRNPLINKPMQALIWEAKAVVSISSRPEVSNTALSLVRFPEARRYVADKAKVKGR